MNKIKNYPLIKWTAKLIRALYFIFVSLGTAFGIVVLGGIVLERILKSLTSAVIGQDRLLLNLVAVCVFIAMIYWLYRLFKGIYRYAKDDSHI